MLIHDEENDYTLPLEEDACWITVNNLSVYIKRTDEGVVIDIYELNDENNEPIASTYAFFSE